MYWSLMYWSSMQSDSHFQVAAFFVWLRFFLLSTHSFYCNYLVRLFSSCTSMPRSNFCIKTETQINSIYFLSPSFLKTVIISYYKFYRIKYFSENKYSRIIKDFRHLHFSHWFVEFYAHPNDDANKRRLTHGNSDLNLFSILRIYIIINCRPTD